MITVRSAREETVLALYAAGAAGDWDAAGALVAPDFSLREPESFSFGGTYMGIDSLRAFYTEIFSAAGKTDIRLDAITSSDDHVVVLATLTMIDRGIEVQVAEAFKFAGDLIRQISVYYLDPPRVAEIYAEVSSAIARNFPQVRRMDDP
jgi:ketosteroid isomerase-like protein